MEEIRSVSKMLERLKRFLKIKSDRDLSNYLGLSYNTISMWKQRDTIDYDRILEKCPDISIDYLLSGVTPEIMSERNRILNYFQIPLLQMDIDDQIKITSTVPQIESNKKIEQIEDDIKKIYKILSEKF